MSGLELGSLYRLLDRNEPGNLDLIHKCLQFYLYFSPSCVITLPDIAVFVAVPSEGPIVVVNGKPGRNEAELVWKEIPQESRRGFITNYTIFYTSGSDIHSMHLH